jgi:hypothetical protein
MPRPDVSLPPPAGYTPGPRQAVADPPPGYVTEAECARRVKAEREACAQVAWNFDGSGVDVYAWPSHIAAAIRARQEGE